MSKIFTTHELETLHNTKFFEVKAAATKKIEQLFAEVRDELKSEIEKNKFVFPAEVDTVTGKIFRGENYLGLPYLVLDYPKHFSKESVLAFRTMFWWGNFFSLTLHLQGKALEDWRMKRQGPIPTFPFREEDQTYICVSNTPWKYHYEKDNYVPIASLSETDLQKILFEKEFIKLSRKISLKEHEQLKDFSRESFLYLWP